MPTRERLPNRRLHISFRFKHGDSWFTCGLGYFVNGRLAEIFLNADKIDSDLDIISRDAAIAASIALQYGCSPHALYRSMTRNPDNSSSGPLGRVLEMIVKDKI